MIEPLHLYPKTKERLQRMEAQGYRINKCNSWICPFNNDCYCVSAFGGDECLFDENFMKLLEELADDSRSDDFREGLRYAMQIIWERISE